MTVEPGRYATGQWLTPPDGRVWYFDAGSLSLAFGYTGDFGHGRPEWETLRSAADLDAWLADRVGRVTPASDARVFSGALRLREAITTTARRRAAGHQPEPHDVDTITAAAAGAPIAPHLEGGTRPQPIPTPARALTTIAADAVRTFSAPADRIRECVADDCRLIFLDASRPGSRRWCSMRRCGGRAKARDHYARTR